MGSGEAEVALAEPVAALGVLGPPALAMRAAGPCLQLPMAMLMAIPRALAMV